MEAAIEVTARLIFSADYVVALTGAGVSVESMIRPFTGPGGIWTESGEPPMDGYRRFLADPKAHWEESMRPRRESGFGTSITEAEPNPGHLALAEMEVIGLLKSLITQNIDNLHIAAGSGRVLEIHGNARKLRCVSCSARFPRDGFDLSELPLRCPECGGIVKSDTVIFGEPIPSDVLEQCLGESGRSDCMLLIGTSAIVYPAAGLPLMVKRNGGSLLEVNPLYTELSNICDICVQAPSGEALPMLVLALERLKGRRSRIFG